MDWCRLWHDMPTDPKWKVIARKSGQSIPEVIAVYTHMLVAASKADDRGALATWDDEDVAAALDMNVEDVAAIRDAMQGKVLDGNRLSGWEKRQPQRDAKSTERTRRYRERKQNERDTEQDQEHGETRSNTRDGSARAGARARTTEQRRGEKSRESHSNECGSAAAADEQNGSEEPADLVKQIFDTGVAILCEAGVSKKNARSKIGHWRKSYQDGPILNALIQARKNSAVEPIAYVEKTLQGGNVTRFGDWRSKPIEQMTPDQLAD